MTLQLEGVERRATVENQPQTIPDDVNNMFLFDHKRYKIEKHRGLIFCNRILRNPVFSCCIKIRE